MAFFSSSVTLGPTYNEFRYNEHSTITTRFLCIKNIDNITKRFGYNEQFLLHLCTCCKWDRTQCIFYTQSFRNVATCLILLLNMFILCIVVSVFNKRTFQELPLVFVCPFLFTTKLAAFHMLHVNSINKAAKVLATCLSNGQKLLLLLTSLWPKILDNWQHWHQTRKWGHANDSFTLPEMDLGTDSDSCPMQK